MTEIVEKPVKKRRSEEEKYGKYKWLRILIRRNAEDSREIKRLLRGVLFELRHKDRDSTDLLDLVCRDGRDAAILDVLREAGSSGVLPKDIYAKVAKFGLQYHHISRRINAMNKKLKEELNERVADKVGSKWALSDFMRCNWSAADKAEIKAEGDKFFEGLGGTNAEDVTSEEEEKV